jgi:hypothetical protein
MKKLMKSPRMHKRLQKDASLPITGKGDKMTGYKKENMNLKKGDVGLTVRSLTFPLH